MSLLPLLKARIAESGPLSVADYMEACLLHPEFGYYTTREPFGREGDFTTAPEISQIFGELIGAWLAARWQAMGAPSPCLLLELGPGRGTLMRDVLRATRHVPGFHAALHIYMLEASEALREQQRAALAGAHPQIRWIDTLDMLPAKPLLFIANEFFDALPIRQFTPSGEEIKIGITEDALQFVIPENAGILLETCAPATAIITELAAHIARHGGAGLIVDYGYSSGHGNTLQAVRRHAYADPLHAPGEADLTAHVDFAALIRAAHESGAGTSGPLAQGEFLRRMGAELRAHALCQHAPAQAHAILSGLERLVAPHAMGMLFKVLALHPPGQIFEELCP